MASDLSSTGTDLKKILLKDVAHFCQNNARWKTPVIKTLRELKSNGIRSVFFGGTLRSLLVGRMFSNRPGRPRDIDLVVADISSDSLRTKFHDHIVRETRFGGLKIRRRTWQFDVWPLGRTRAFLEDATNDPGFCHLPYTTFLNLEAIAVDVWPRPGHARRIYAGDDQFFDGLLNRTIEINREQNPFPILNVVRSLVLASSLMFKIGPHLARYIASHGNNVTPEELEAVQHKHYGVVRRMGSILRDWIRFVTERHAFMPSAPVQLPVPRQIDLWHEDDTALNIRFQLLT
jgi:hypothetical protein